MGLPDYESVGLGNLHSGSNLDRVGSSILIWRRGGPVPPTQGSRSMALNFGTRTLAQLFLE